MMIPWLQTHFNGNVYLTLAVMAMALTALAWALQGRGFPGGRSALAHAMAVRVLLALACALWIGLGLRNEWDVVEPWSLLLTAGTWGILSGLFFLLPAAWLRLRRWRLGRTAQQCVGRYGRVERTMTAPDGLGLVTLTDGGRKISLPARSQTRHTTLVAFTPVQVLSINEEGQAIVQAVAGPDAE